MTSRERILAAIDHRQPDRVPVDLGSTPSSGISAIAYGNLKTHLALTHGAVRVYDVVQQLAQPEDEVLDRFRVDVVDVGRAFNTEEPAWRPTVLADGQTALCPAWFHPERQPDGAFVARMPDGRHYLFSYFEYAGSDFAADTARMAADPRTQEWWSICEPCQQPLADRASGEWWAGMEEVFHHD